MIVHCTIGFYAIGVDHRLIRELSLHLGIITHTHNKEKPFFFTVLLNNNKPVFADVTGT